MSRVILGIDLGTTNSVVAATRDGRCEVLADKSGRAVQPSVVCFHPNGQVLVGHEAKQRRAIDPRNTLFSVKRLIGRGIHARETQEMRERMPFAIVKGENQQPVVKTRAGLFSIPEISAQVLAHVKAIAEEALGQEVSDAVITVPASFTEAQRNATADAGSIAGLNVVRIINEPTAAAVAFGFQKELLQTIAVYDFGGGTFDISILRVEGDRFEVLSSAGDSFLGGDDIDERIVRRMCGEFLATHSIDLREDTSAMQRLYGVAEQIKIELGERTRSVVKLDEIAYGDGGKAIDLKIEVTRSELEEMASELVRQTFPVCDEALRQAGLSARDISALVLVGGTTKMPLVRTMASTYFQREARSDVNPDEAIALGAALQGQAIAAAASVAAAGRTTRPGMGATPTTTSPDPFEDEVTTVADEGSEDVTTVADEGSADVTAVADGGSADVTVERSPAAAPPPVPGAPTARSGDSTLAKLKMVKRRVATGAGAIVEKGGGLSQEALFDEAPTAQRPAPPVASPEPPPVMPAPMIYEVTPQALGVATVAGFCEHVIKRNTAIPTEVVKVFATSRDDQRTVRLRVCQGNARRMDENTQLGDLVLDDLPTRRRGETKIEVTFRLDASGRLRVKARDPATGKEQQASLELIAAQSRQELDMASERLRAMRK